MKYIKSLLFFFTFFCLLSWSVRLVKPKTYTTESGVESRDIHAVNVLSEPAQTLQVLFLGDSEIQTGVLPMELWKTHGITSYICGQSGQRTMESYFWLKEVLKTQTPKLVVLETDQFYHCRDIQTELKHVIKNAAHYYFPVFKYHNRWKAWFNQSDVASKTERNPLKGYNYHDETRPYTGGPYMEETDKKERSKPMVRFWIDRILDLCRKNNIEVLLIGVPAPLNWSYERHNEVNEYALGKGVPYLDFNLMEKELKINWKTDTMDGGDHLNMNGAKKVTEYLGAYLKKNYALSDYRENQMFQYWHRDWKKYKEITGKPPVKAGDF